MGAIVAWLAKPAVKWGAVALAVLAMAGIVTWVLTSTYKAGTTAGKAEVTGAVQKKTIETTTEHQQRKDRIDDEVAKTPYKDKLDALD